MSKQGICDRCGGDFPGFDGQDDVVDFLLKEYPQKQICINCDRDIQIAYITAVSGISIEEYCKQMLRHYQ